jgi:hypothetical protein
MGHLLMKNPLPHTFHQERFDTFHFETFRFDVFCFDVFLFDVFLFDVFSFDAFRFTTGRFLDSYAHTKAFSDPHRHRKFCCDSIDNLYLSIFRCKLFDPERFNAFRCAPSCTLRSLSSISICVLDRSRKFCIPLQPIRCRLFGMHVLPALLLTVAATLCFRAPACRYSA